MNKGGGRGGRSPRPRRVNAHEQRRCKNRRPLGPPVRIIYVALDVRCCCHSCHCECCYCTVGKRLQKQTIYSCGVNMSKDDAITDGHWGCCSCRCECCDCTVAKRRQKQTMCSCGIDTHAQRRCKDKRALGPLVFDTAASLAVANVATRAKTCPCRNISVTWRCILRDSGSGSGSSPWDVLHVVAAQVEVVVVVVEVTGKSGVNR